MAVDTKEIGIYVRKGLIFSIRTCYRSMREHPVVWGVGFFFLFLYRCFPFLFGFLLSSSPVLICTAVLLGTLLSFGNPHIPEVEREEKTTHGIASLKTGVFKNDVVVKKDEIFSVEARVEKKDNDDEKAVEEASPVGEGRDCKVEKEVLSSSSSTHGEGLMGSIDVPGEEPKGTLGGKQVVEEKEREFCSSKVVEKREFQEESVSRACEDVEGQFSENQKDAESLKEEIEQQAGKLPDIQLEDHADTSQNFSWKLEEEHAESDSESDHAESSSPDASMADIIPMLDELHPLLELEASLQVQDSDAASEHSHGSDDGSAELEEETENQEEEEDEDDEEVQGEQEISAKSVVMWTEDDQKNLIDLGTSELERNQRLENLLAKRSARKALRMEAEKNLIDLDSNDPPFYVAPILTTRNNPFDLPYDSNESMGLPAIPGSAPSVLLPRRNPFDLPYDSLEEKPNLIGDDVFQKEFMAINQKDTFFRRHESFSLGACVEHKKKKCDIKMKPYFVTEQMAFEDEEYPIFQRQSRDKGDSKLSSALETESLSSEEDHEDQRSIEQDSSQETEQIFHVDHMSDHVECESHTFGEVGSMEIEQEEKRDVHISNIEVEEVEEKGHETEPILPVIESITSPTTPDKIEEEERDVHVSNNEVKVADEENCHETEPILPVTESITSPMTPDKIEEEKRDVHVSNFEVKVADEENGHETEPIFPVTGSRTSPMTPDKIEEEKRDVHISNNEVKVADEENCHETEPILPVTESITSPMTPDKIEEEERDVHVINNEVKVADEENCHETPILPVTESITSPMTPDKIEIHVKPEIVEDDSGASFSSLSEMDAKKFHLNTDEESGNLKSTISDQTQSPGGSMQSSLTEEKIYFRTQAAEGLHENQTKEPVYDSSPGEIEKNLSNITSIEEGCICVDKGVPVSSSSISSDKQAEISEVGSPHMSIERADGEQEFHNGSIREEMAPAIGLQATSLDLCAVDEHDLETREVTEVSEHGVIEVGFSGANQNSDTPNVPVVPELVVEKVSVVSTSSDNSELIVNDPVQEDLNPHFEQDHASSSSLDPEIHVGTHQYDSNQKMDTVDSSFSAVENSASHELEEVLPLIEKLKPVPYSVGDHEETQGPSTLVLNSLGEANTINARELVAQDPDNKDLSNLSPLIPLPVFVRSGVSENKSTEDLMDGLDEIDKNNSQFEHLDDAGEAVYPHPTKEFSENADEIKEIDEELLLELDKVGDFSFKEFESTRNKIEEQSNLEVHESISTMQVSEGNLEDSVTLVKCRSDADQSTKSGDSPGVPEESHRHFDVNSTSEVQVLEESSMDDIDSVIKQPEGEDVEESIVLEPLKYEQLPKESEVGFDELKLINQDLIPINNSSQLPVEEAGSVEDYDSTFKQLHEVQQTTVTVSLNDKPVKEENEVRYTEAFHDKLLKESADGSIESGKSDGEFNATMTNFELPVLEARSFEDIKLAFKQLHEEGADFEIPVLPEPNDNKPHVVEFQHPNGIGSDMQIVEARSLEDIHSTLKVPLVYNMENLNYSEVEDGSAEVEAQELESTGVVDLRFAESEGTNLSAEGSNHGVNEKVDSTSLNESGENYNKERSYESSSGSNTSDS
uniref:Uncharacterized protein n=1 Tax=Nelumbo nucifera TaxID=4432 RepID=A0A822ZJL2_NELNU|nr:TPA_asm: hypothetical protein HUJ06_002021 [Nelumbo nucifera]